MTPEKLAEFMSRCKELAKASGVVIFHLEAGVEGTLDSHKSKVPWKKFKWPKRRRIDFVPQPSNEALEHVEYLLDDGKPCPKLDCPHCLPMMNWLSYLQRRK